jgi:hypothetical protein
MNGKIIAVLSLSFLITSNIYAEEYRHHHQPIVNAALMISGGENFQCTFGNINDTYIVEVLSADDPDKPRFITSGSPCVVLPITAKPGTDIGITGVLQDTLAIFGTPLLSRRGSAYVIHPTNPIVEGCFNVEGFSVGLGAIPGSEYDPRASENIINNQGYGLFWYDSDEDLAPGPYHYKVVSCYGHNCPTETTYYNSDAPGAGTQNCTVLKPLS